MSTQEPARRLDLPGTFNLRDVGGYATVDGRQTRWRTLLRSDSLHRLTPESLHALRTYGLRTVVDLRESAERSGLPNPLERSTDLRYLPVSLTPPESAAQVGSLGDLYRLILDRAQPQVKRIVEALGEDGALPALVHCHAGKDRTGVVTALLLGLAGVSVETIADDYALTATYLTAEFHGELQRQFEESGRNWELMQPFLGSPRELMLATCAYLDEQYGGPRRYLEGVGVPAARLDALRLALTEDVTTAAAVPA